MESGGGVDLFPSDLAGDSSAVDWGFRRAAGEELHDSRG